ncbi:MAG: HAD family phosphatase, partial [Actinomycetota bacterium]|nr:HAD family phosphatase [Actinomycetota bacterium]
MPAATTSTPRPSFAWRTAAPRARRFGLPAPGAAHQAAAVEETIPAVLVSSDGLERGKPDPECFLVAARLLGADPRRGVVLE